MNKRPFKAANWLSSSQPKDSFFTNNISASSKENYVEGKTSYPAIPKVLRKTQADDFLIGNYIIPQWKGESLITKDGLKLQNFIKNLYLEAIESVKIFPTRNKKMKIQVYTEFVNFVESQTINATDISNFNDFWKHYQNKNSPCYTLIKEFLAHYSLRSVNVYLMKVRFLTLLSDQIKKELDTCDYLNPNSALNRIFKKASSSEIHSSALNPNEFSWFRPSIEFSSKVNQLVFTLRNLSATEFLRICNHEAPLSLNLKLKGDKSEAFSHAISNRNFGLFVNDLLINFPQWIEQHNGYCSLNNDPKCLNTLFSGDFLNSFAISHWIAQEESLDIVWDEVICPEFKGERFKTGCYLKICQELQFLTFLTELAKKQNHEPVKLICSLFNQKNTKSSSDPLGQMTFFNIEEQKQESIYDRIVLNISDLPKKNPHHFLLSKISSQGEKLSNNGYMYVFANQNLFVPSHCEKVEMLLKKYKLISKVSFENLAGRGEVCKNLFIFTKRIYSNSSNLLAQNSLKIQKESCLSLSFSGQLMHFSKFEALRNEFHKFVSNLESINSPIYQSELESDLNFDFHQDAILNGKLLSNDSDKNSFAHPQYFKKLTRTCLPFDQFFMVENLNSKEVKAKTDLLGLPIKKEDRFPLMLIVNFTDENNIKLEITSSDLYKAKVEEYGNAFFQYFGLVPKITNLNINLFRDFFQTPVGKQIIQLTFNGTLRKTKAKLKAMLVPKFISEFKFIPDYQLSSLNFYGKTTDEVKNLPHKDFQNNLEFANSYVNRLKNDFPWHTACLLSQFKYTIEEVLNDLQDQYSNLEINYNNPSVMEPIIELETSPIYPSNDDIFIEANLRERNEIHSQLMRTELLKKKDGSVLKLCNEEKEIITLHGEYELLHFTSFILSSAIGQPISGILQALEVPRADDLIKIVRNKDLIKSNLVDASEQIQQLISQIIIFQVTKI